METFVLGVLADQGGELGHELLVPPAVKVGLDSRFDDDEAQLLELRDRSAGEVRVGELGQWRSPPERERLRSTSAEPSPSPSASRSLPRSASC